MTPTEQYDTLFNGNLKSLLALAEGIISHAEKQRSDPENFGYIGDMNMLARRLDELQVYFPLPAPTEKP